jgi:cytochrome c-type biogenesis protein CcmH/NrfG
MDIRLKFLYFCTVFFITTQLPACATGREYGQLLPEESRATPELALLNERARLADAGGEAAQAEALYKSVLRQTPNDTETWFRLANLYANNNRAAEAAIAYERTIVSDNSHVRAWHNLSIIRLRQSYAALLQAHTLVDENDPMGERIDSALEQLSKLSILESEPRPLISRPGTEPAKPANGNIISEPEASVPADRMMDEATK